jgi:ribosomal protein S18 acetylase RimI-like enzyme
MSSTSFGPQKTASAGGLSIVEDSWLTGVMSRSVHHVSGTVEEDGEKQAQCTLRQITDRPGFSYARVPTHHVRTSRLLERNGFHVVDTGITLETRQLPERRGGSSRARPARIEDQAVIEEIARRSFIYSRFHLDPDIPKHLADEIKTQWVGNYFRGQRGDYMVLAERAGHVAGFLQLLNASGNVLVIDLIAVEKDYRGQGLAEEMIRYAVSACGTPTALRVGTQSANLVSLSLYEKLGFHIVSTSYVLHYHGTES